MITFLGLFRAIWLAPDPFFDQMCLRWVFILMLGTLRSLAPPWIITWSSRDRYPISVKYEKPCTFEISLTFWYIGASSVSRSMFDPSVLGSLLVSSAESAELVDSQLFENFEQLSIIRMLLSLEAKCPSPTVESNPSQLLLLSNQYIFRLDFSLSLELCSFEYFR